MGDLPGPETLAKIEWKRISDVYPDATLFGSQNIRPQDILQGHLGNCWFLAAAASIAEHRGRMETVFAQELSVPGGFAVNLFTLGVPSTIVIDDFIPFVGEKPLAAQIADDHSIWPMVLEKAMAKLRGNYLHISSGYPSIGVRYMLGGPSEKFNTKYMTPNEIFTQINEHLNNGDLVR